MWFIYETRNLPVRLDYLPPDCLGLAYEKLIREVKDREKTSTSFYTPEELINEITNRLKLKPSDKILEPTCGSGAFLISCIQKIDPENVKEYIEKMIFGYDNDWYACQIAKASLLAKYASLLPYDPIDISEKGLRIPKVNIECKDFFEVGYNTKYDVILGNPPWSIL